MAKQTKSNARAELADLLREAAGIEVRLQAVKADERRKEKIKDRIRELCTAFPDLFEQRTTLTKALPSSSPATAGATVTFPEPVYDIDYDRFRALVGDDIFHEVFQITKAVLDLEKWGRVVTEERATDSQMRECQIILPSSKPAVKILPPVAVESVS